MCKELFQDGKFSEAETLASEAIQFSPDDPLLHEIRGDTRLKTKPIHAVRDFEKAALLLDGSVNPIRLFNGINAPNTTEDATWDRLSAMFEDGPLTNGAKVKFLIFTLERLRNKITSARTAVGSELLHQGCAEEAVIEMTDALRASTASQVPSVLLIRSRAKDVIGDYAGAVKDLHMAVEADNTFSPAWNSLSTRGPVLRSSLGSPIHRLSVLEEQRHLRREAQRERERKKWRESSAQSLVINSSMFGLKFASWGINSKELQSKGYLGDAADVEDLEQEILNLKSDNGDVNIGRERLEIQAVIQRKKDNITIPYRNSSSNKIATSGQRRDKRLELVFSPNENRKIDNSQIFTTFSKIVNKDNSKSFVTPGRLRKQDEYQKQNNLFG